MSFRVAKRALCAALLVWTSISVADARLANRKSDSSGALRAWKVPPLLAGPWKQYRPGYDVMRASNGTLLCVTVALTGTKIAFVRSGMSPNRTVQAPFELSPAFRMAGSGADVWFVDRSGLNTFGVRACRIRSDVLRKTGESTPPAISISGEPGLFRNFALTAVGSAKWLCVVTGDENADNASELALRPMAHWYTLRGGLWHKFAAAALGSVEYHAPVSMCSLGDQIATGIGDRIVLVSRKTGRTENLRVLPARSRERIVGLAAGEKKGQLLLLAADEEALSLMSVFPLGVTRSSRRLLTTRLRRGSPVDARMITWSSDVLVSFQEVRGVSRVSAGFESATVPLFACAGLRFFTAKYSRLSGPPVQVDL